MNSSGDNTMTDYSKRTPLARHGGAYDRGMADSYYRRPYEPHYFTGATYSSTRIDEVDMSAEEIAAYKQGYNDNEKSGAKKDY
jgi:hypothetical protein